LGASLIVAPLVTEVSVRVQTIGLVIVLIAWGLRIATDRLYAPFVVNVP
jgi:hypothetical protein